MRTALISGLLSTVLLVACGPSPQPAAMEQANSSPPAAAAPETRGGSVATLSGVWRVAGIDGRSLDEPVGLALTGDEHRLWWEPRCAGMARNYRIDGHSIRFGPTQPPPPAESPTPPVCAIGLPPRLDDVFRALDAATSVGRTPENGVLIAGGGHSVTLFSQ